MSKQIYLNNEGKAGLLEGINRLADAVASTLGPSGKTVIIKNGNEDEIITKDGVTVAKSVDAEDPLENCGIQMVKKTATKMDTDNGDGTTSATILCREMIRRGMDQQNTKPDMISYVKGMNHYAKGLFDFIEKNTVKIKENDSTALKQVATISSNNDSELGALIAEATIRSGAYGHVNIREGKRDHDYIDVLDGFLFDLGIADNAFANNQETGFFESAKCAFILKTEKFTDAKEWYRITNDVQKYLLDNPDVILIAQDYSTEIINLAKYWNRQSSKKICLVRNGLKENEFNSIYEDIAAFTGATIVTDYDSHNVMGRANNIVCKPGITIIGDTNVNFDEHVSFLKKKTDNETLEFNKTFLKRRISRFENGVVTFFIALNSDIEVKEKKDRVVDAYSACKAAIEEGIVIGGGHLLYKYAAKKEYETGSDSYSLGINNMHYSIKSIFNQIIQNCGEENINKQWIQDSKKPGNFGIDFKKMKYVNLLKSGIIDPKKIVVNAVKNALSVASTILNTECVIIEKTNHEN